MDHNLYNLTLTHISQSKDHMLITRRALILNLKIIMYPFIIQTNLKLQCVVFDRIWETCLNMFGMDKAVKKARCFVNFIN